MINIVNNVKLSDFFGNVSISELEEIDNMFSDAYGKENYEYHIWQADGNKWLFDVFLKDRIYGNYLFYLNKYGWSIDYHNKHNNLPYSNEEHTIADDFINKTINEINNKYYPYPEEIQNKFLKLETFIRDNILENAPFIKEIRICDGEPVIQLFTTIGENDYNNIEAGVFKSGLWYCDPGRFYEHYNQSLKDLYYKIDNFIDTLRI